jgi:hypothetical protein
MEAGVPAATQQLSLTLHTSAGFFKTGTFPRCGLGNAIVILFQLWEVARSYDQLIALYKRGQGLKKRCEPSYIITINGENSALDNFVPVEALCTFALTKTSPESESMVYDISRVRSSGNMWALLATPRSGGHARLATALWTITIDKDRAGVVQWQDFAIGSFLHPFELKFYTGGRSTGNAACAVDSNGNRFKTNK